MGLKEVKSSKMPDDMTLMHKLLELNLLIKTPAQDYDDSYCINYARKVNAFMVTNDKFRDYIDNLYVKLAQYLARDDEEPKNSSPGKQKVTDSIYLDKKQIQAQ